MRASAVSQAPCKCTAAFGSYHTDTYLNHDDTFLLTMTLIFKMSVMVIYFGVKQVEFKSFNFNFSAFNFDTIKLIFSAKASQTLMPQSFLEIEKERKLQYQWYHNFRSYVVRVTGLEPAASCSQSRRATSCATPGNNTFALAKATI